MPEPTKIQIVVETSATTKELQNYKTELEQAVGAARTAGRSTKGLEKELSGVNSQLASSKLKDYRAALVQAADAARKAGQDTSAFDKKLKALDTATPASGLQKMGGALKQAFGQIPGVGAFTSFFNGSGKAVAGFAGIVLSVGVGALISLVGLMKQVISTGVSFNSTLEDSQLGIAAVFKQFDDTGKFASFDDAMEESAAAIDLLKQKALESPASFEQLVSAYQGTVGAMASSGMDMQQQVNTVVTMSQTLAGLGIQSGQILQETRAILTGNITEDAAAARILGLTREMIQTAQEEGNLYEFLQQKMSSFAEAGVRSSQTLTTKLSNLGDSAQQLSGQFAKPFFESLKSGADTAQAALNQLQKAIDYFQPPKSEGKSEVEELADQAREAELEIRNLNAARVDDLKTSAENAGNAFDGLASKIRASAREADAMDEAQTKRALAQIDLEEQKALAAAGNDDAARSKIQSEANARRRETQSAREGRRSSRSVKAENQIVEEIGKQIAEKSAAAAANVEEANRAKATVSDKAEAAKALGLPIDDLAALAEAVAPRLEEIAALQDRIIPENFTGILKPEQTSYDTPAQQSALAARLEELLLQQKAADEFLGAMNYQSVAEAKSKEAKAALEKFKAGAEPQLEEAKSNVAKGSLEEEARLIKEEAELKRIASEEQRAEDDRRIASLEKQKQLLAEQGRTALENLKAQGANAQQIGEAKLKIGDANRAIEMEIARIRGDADTQAALHAEERKRELQVLAAASYGPATSPTGGAPFTPQGFGGGTRSDVAGNVYGVNGRNITPPSIFSLSDTRPGDLGPALTPRGSAGAGTAPGSRPPTASGGGGELAGGIQDLTASLTKQLTDAINGIKGTTDAVNGVGGKLVGSIRNLEKRVSTLEAE